MIPAVQYMFILLQYYTPPPLRSRIFPLSVLAVMYCFDRRLSVSLCLSVSLITGNYECIFLNLGE